MLRVTHTILFIVFLIIASACSKFTRIQKLTDPIKKYEGAVEFYTDEEYYKASVLFEEVIPIIKTQKEGETAQFYFAYCHFHLKDYTLAAFYFEKFYNIFRRSVFAEEALYMNAYSLYKDSSPFQLDQTTTLKAIIATQNMLNTYKTTQYKDGCNKIITELRQQLEKKAFEQAKLYYKISNYRAAVVLFDNFQKEFPDSNYNEEVAYLKILAQYKFAKISTERRLEERYNDAVKYYEYFIDFYPESKYIKFVENIYDDCLNQLGKIRKKV